MTLEEFKGALAAADTWSQARAVVAQIEDDFGRMSNEARKPWRRAWKDRQAELAAMGETKPVGAPG
jgi:hypothetical protein